MLRCKFHLNSQSLSNLSCPGVGFFPPIQALRAINETTPVLLPRQTKGPLPPGKYYIVDRPKGYGSAIKRLCFKPGKRLRPQCLVRALPRRRQY